MVLQVPLLLCPIFGPMIDCWHRVKLEMLFAVIVLLNTCTVFITKVRSHWFPNLSIYDPNLPHQTVSFRYTFILHSLLLLTECSTAAFSFRNGNAYFYFLQILTVVIFRCLSLSYLNVSPLCDQHTCFN